MGVNKIYLAKTELKYILQYGKMYLIHSNTTGEWTSIQHENKNYESQYQPNSKANVAQCTYHQH